jgi:hypothetical protein
MTLLPICYPLNTRKCQYLCPVSNWSLPLSRLRGWGHYDISGECVLEPGMASHAREIVFGCPGKRGCFGKSLGMEVKSSLAEQITRSVRVVPADALAEPQTAACGLGAQGARGCCYEVLWLTLLSPRACRCIHGEMEMKTSVM